MSEPFLAEIRMVGFNFPPRGWAFCDGQLLPINQNQSLFALLGVTYGGDGQTTFALPDLRGRAPVHVGDGVPLGQKGGEETHTLTEQENPRHGHTDGSGNQATLFDPTAAVVASRPRRGARIYTAPSNLVTLAGAGTAGGGQAHENIQPFLTVNFAIALTGVFPPRN